MGTRFALGTILLLCLLLPYLSTADDIYRPDDLLSINCGTSNNLFTRDGRNWTGDIKFLVQSHNDSDGAPALTPSTIEGPYTHARLSHSQFSYSFPVTPGTPKFLRLFFYSTSYQNFDSPKAYFSVKAGPYTLLHHFNASLNADNDDDPSHPDILFREYCINLEDGQNHLNITFIPSTTDSYAFINGIEIVSMPPYLYYTNPDDYSESPQLVDKLTQYTIGKSSALETLYRLKAGLPIPSSEDTGMLRTWDSDDNYLITSQIGELSSEFTNFTKLSFTMTPNYTAPDAVYRTVRVMGRNVSMNKRVNLTWNFPVDSGFNYLLRLYFCELNHKVNRPGDLTFSIFIQDQLATELADVLLWTRQKAVPVVKEYVVMIHENSKKINLSLKMHPLPESLMQDTQVNAIEIFKISNGTYSLAGQNPDPLPARNPVLPNKKSTGSKKTLAAVAGAVSGFVLISLIVAAIFLIKRKNKLVVEKESNKKEGTSRGRGGGSSSLPTNLCRHFSIAEIRAATNNFDQVFVVGKGGFGNVYRGYIDDGSTCVAIKRLKPGSQQGVHEFVNEIEMLSQLRHLHLVSLIGYCYESNEMILVYDFMGRGTLREHLYDTDNPTLSWKQRLQICIGAARGLEYLHTGAKQMIIHRDVKSTNILLDDKWVAKVSDFGLSRVGPTGSSMTHVSTVVKGSIGYLDPEYYKRQRLTEKSDVYSFGVVLLEVLCGRQPLLRTVEKKEMSLADWAKHRYETGSLGEIVDPGLKGKITTQCLHKFGEIALRCLLEDGTQRPSMNHVVGVLEFLLQLQDTADLNVMLETRGDYEDSEDMFSSTHTHSSIQLSEYSNTTDDGDHSYGSKDSHRLIPDLVFSEIKDPKGR